MPMQIDADPAALSQVLASIPEIVLVVDRQGMIRYINRVEPGYDRAAVVGAPAEQFLFPETRAEHRAAIEAVFTTGEPAEYEVEVDHAAGKLWYRSRMFPYRRNGEVTGVTIIAENISELKRAQSTVAQLRELLPVCAWCGRIRNDAGSWEKLEAYLAREQDTQVTHGMCPECLKQVEGEEA